ncbi:MAG: aminotransferase class I and II [Muribaculaceae bacterium]|nr:aminotransferase class I and II [Muribaculaceae bacterium]
MSNSSPIRQQRVTRYITPLREGGSLPALAEADDGFRYVVKFRGSGHGKKVLVAELIGAEIARLAGLNVPEVVFLDLDEDFGRTEGDEEIQDLLQASRGLNLGLHFLNGALTWDVAANHTDTLTASIIVWVDALLTNIDRTARNTNMLLWNKELWLIDHGASLYFHHSWKGWEKAMLSDFPYVKDHALLRDAALLGEVDDSMHRSISVDDLNAIVDMVPDEWLDEPDSDISVEERRQVYKTFLRTRFENSKNFTNHAIEVRNQLFG